MARYRVDRELPSECFYNLNRLPPWFTQDLLVKGVRDTYKTIDAIDSKLLDSDSPRLSQLVELANLSSILGNLLAGGICKYSNDTFTRAGPHKYQDLRTSGLIPESEHVEIKVALESNTPKGHLPKAGYYLTCRYVLADVEGKYIRGARGDVIWIWEMRFGHLDLFHFNISNTAGDSGKTAVVNQAGMKELTIVYFDPKFSPLGPKSRYSIPR